jgi:hypothetical protein
MRHIVPVLFWSAVTLGFAALPQLASAQSALLDPYQIDPHGTPPSADEIRDRADKFVANQHRDDQALEQYERIEHHVSRTAGSNSRVTEDKLYRIVPTGAGTIKVVLQENEKPVDDATYDREMQNLVETLQGLANPNDDRAKTALAKRSKRETERAEFVDAAKEAFDIKWLGTANVYGHACDVFQLVPRRDFRPHGIFQDALAHVTAKIWLDRESLQMMRGEANVMSDVSFGAGILGKLNRGSVVSMVQAEIAPGIWLPTHYQYDFTGRKFLFSFEQHQSIDASRYRRIGTASEALTLVQNELANKKPAIVDP